MSAPWEQSSPSMRHRSSTAPNPPRALMPGYANPPLPTDDLSFPSSVPPVPPRPPTVYEHDPHIYLGRSHTVPAPPPIPPKPAIAYMQAPVTPLRPPKVPLESHPASSPPAIPQRPVDNDELEKALAMSKSESSEHAKREEELRAQEEEDLDRALKESLQMFTINNSFSSGSPETPFTTVASSSREIVQEEPAEEQEELFDDEALARQLAAEEVEDIQQEEQEEVEPQPPVLPGYSRGPSVENDNDQSSQHLEPIADSPTSIAPPTYDDVVQPDLLRSSSVSSSSSAAESEQAPEPEPVPSVNQYVDQSLLLGVSVGFTAPSISHSLQPMNGVLPNIISLPYGKCPPLHLQAPNWRHLLKLMAWLSGTRIEPTLEAIDQARANTLYLRTVIQFVRPHHATDEWRTVLWFTIDQPPPPSDPLLRKYTSGNDPDLLPWSYTNGKPHTHITKSSLPTLLRDGDSPLSKIYTIPQTDSIPYPPLPISFPNLAMYLQAALDESRKYMGDSSSGIRKLAKMIETCYPQDHLYRHDTVSTHSGSSSTSARKLLKKVMGRSGGNKKMGNRGGNEDTYELVTPFVPDQWG